MGSASGNDLFKNSHGFNICSVFLVPSVVSLTMTCILFRAVSMTTPRYGTRSCILATLLSIFWITSFIYHQRKIVKEKSGILIIKCNIVVVLALAYIIGIYLACMTWNSGYCSLNPYEKIDNGTAFIDTLFHSSIAESWRRSFYPSTLLNGERYLPYHTFSHLLLGMVSGIMGMPSFVTYSYFYPVIFLPAHCFAALLAISSAKYYFEDKSEIQFLDLIVIGLYIFGVTDNIGIYGVWKTSFFVSESFLVANTLTFFSYALTFYALNHWSSIKRNMTLYCLLVIPAEIFVISWSKISVGFVFTVGMMYFIFRCHLKDLKYWTLDGLYLMIFMLCVRIFGPDRQNIVRFKWFAFEDYISGGLGMWGHYTILSLMTILFIWLEIYRNRFKWSDVKDGKTIWIETIIIMSALAFLPITIMDLASGAAVYFSFAIEIPSMVLLCGHNYINMEQDVKGILKPLIYVVCFCWCVWMGYHHCNKNPLKAITNEHNSNLSDMLLEIREVVGAVPEKYTIYLDTDSVLSQVFTEDTTAVFVCPSMTGVGVINATYEENGDTYCYRGSPVGDAYNLNMVDNEYLSFRDAISTARSRGKEHVIHVTNSGYEVVDLN